MNPDGAEPTEARRRVAQGLFYRGRRTGLHPWALVATDGQHEILKTLVSAAAGVRAAPSSPAGAATTTHPSGDASGRGVAGRADAGGVDGEQDAGSEDHAGEVLARGRPGDAGEDPVGASSARGTARATPGTVTSRAISTGTGRTGSAIV